MAVYIIKAPILGQNLLSDKRIEYFFTRKTQHRDSIGCSDTLDQQAAVEIFIFDSSIWDWKLPCPPVSEIGKYHFEPHKFTFNTRNFT